MRKMGAFLGVLCVCLALAARVAVAQEYDDGQEQGAFGYTSIDFDSSTLEVTAYSETDIYGYGLYYYEPVVSLSACGTVVSKQAQYPETIDVAVTLQCQGTAGQTYTAYGEHSAEIDPNYMGLTNDDYYGLENWEEFDVMDPFSFPFTSFSPETDTNEPMIEVGETYDMASVTIPASCGTNDPRNNMIEEYENNSTPYIPQCSEFTQAISDPHFTFGQLNSGTYTWAIIRSYFLTDMDHLYNLAGSFTINSAYRNPYKEYTIDTTPPANHYYPGSRHQYGDAVDIATNSTTWYTFHADGLTLGACVEPQTFQHSFGHAHLDWRTQATVGPTVGTSCPSDWAK